MAAALARAMSRGRTKLRHLLPPTAAFCTDGDGFQSSRVKIFDRDVKRKHRDRAAWLMGEKDVFVDSVAENLLDRLEDCKRTFPTALCLGGSSEAVRRLLRGRGGIERLIMMDMSFDMVKHLKDSDKNIPDDKLETSFVVGDEEFLPIKESSLELVISCLGLHWTNDLPGAMIQCRLALKPDGLFLAAVLGGETLKAKNSMHHCSNGTRRRHKSSIITFGTALELIEHLRSMGETNALMQRNIILKRETALATAAVYESMFGAEDGTVPATFQVIYMTGWKEHSSQQKAKRRGSATVSFEDIKTQFTNTSA